MKRNQIIEIYGTDYRRMTKELLAKADLLSHLPGKEALIGIKPNLVCPSPANFGATTHPEIVAGLVEFLQEAGYQNLLITEGSWVGDKTADAYEYCGYRELCEKYHVPFFDNQKDRWHEIDAAGMRLNVCDVVDRVDFLINMPVVKGHCQTRVTCALKNLKGLLPNMEKRHFHQMGLHKPIAHLASAVRPDFILVDHICGDPDFEEGGNPLVRNCIFTALDPVLVDAYACKELGVDVSDVPYIGMAERLGVGSSDLAAADIIRLNSTSEAKATPPLSEKRVLEVSYAADECDSCSACYASLIPALYRLKEEGLLEKLPCKIAIGQGHRGKTGLLGVGACTSGFDYNIPGCPPDEDAIYEGLKAFVTR